MNDAAQAVVEMALGMVSTWGIRVIGALALLIVGRIAAGWVRNSVRKGLVGANMDASLVPFFSSMGY